ncbi:MAG: class I SAM-dependent DNA methyltransferase, partial [Chloroflexi bacterium]|nr:class I SAM-dependent DNA methyltransferase [Chloroflexota bacterium]
DFGDLPLFEATAYPMVIVFAKGQPGDGQALHALEVEDLGDVDHLTEAVRSRAWAQPQISLRADGWALVRPDVRALMRKLREAGTPLAEYVKGRFYYGIKTGLNEAFVIDGATRDRLVAEDPRSAEIIRPWLRGRDVKRWRVEWGGEYLIAIQNSGDADARNPWAEAADEAEARAVFERCYPAVHAHLSRYEDALRKRWDQGRYWWELRACRYYSEFAKPKIIYPDIAKECQFAFDEGGFVPDCTLFIVPMPDMYLLGLLNSRVLHWFIGNVSPAIQHGFLRFKQIYLERMPIAVASSAQRHRVETAVRELLQLVGDEVDASACESEINQLVYSLYGLDDAEVAIIEEKTAV